jgi:uncharacterized protein related to proFAR isomerase
MELVLKFKGFTGNVVMKAATNLDRLELMEKLNVNIMELATSSEDSEKDRDKFASTFLTTSNIIALLKESKDYYISVDLKKGKKEFKSFDDLNDDSDCQTVLMECATKALLGLGDSESKK